MKERPIIFSGPMVRASHEDRKTQTRRILNHEKLWFDPEDPMFEVGWGSITRKRRDGEEYPGERVFGVWGDGWCVKAPYGGPGDRLWVRETWQTWSEFDCAKTNDISAEARLRLNYLADGNTWDARLRPSAQMPRWASRITLEITGIRVERVQEISDGDAMREGFPYHHLQPEGAKRRWFRELWDSVYAKRGFGWDVNPWVWVVEFKRVEGGAA